jgi:hypothetical protein
MLNQSFSAENFRRILDLENRKGLYLEGRFFPNITEITKKIKKCTKEIKDKQKNGIGLDNEIEELYKRKKELKEEKNEKLNTELQKVSEKVVASDFKIQLEKKDFQNAKSLYVTKDSPENYFTMKQVQRNISRLFDVKQSNRNEIVSQVKNLLKDGFPKYVLKTDIDNFYESIHQKILLNKINDDNLLTPFSKKILRNIIKQYTQLSGSNNGVPRGIGVSAYLAELFMRDVDNKIKSMGEISYYARYIDDIIIIFTPKTNAHHVDYLKEIKNIIEDKFCLKLNDQKTDTFDLLDPKQSSSYTMEYLGYKITFGTGEIKTELSQKKYDKYKQRIYLIFNDYFNLSKFDEKKAKKLLVKRVRFLTGNTRLKNNKKNILVGVYYSNRQLTEREYLTRLDDCLRTKINSSIISTKLKERLEKYNFIDGFKTKRFSPFKTNEIQEIVKIWQ